MKNIQRSDIRLKNISLSPRRIGYYYPFKKECNDHDSAYFTYSEVFISNIFLKFILRGIVGQRLLCALSGL